MRACASTGSVIRGANEKNNWVRSIDGGIVIGIGIGIAIVIVGRGPTKNASHRIASHASVRFGSCLTPDANIVLHRPIVVSLLSIPFRSIPFNEYPRTTEQTNCTTLRVVRSIA